MKLSFEKINIADIIIIVALQIALFVAIHSGASELQTTIAAGLIGYIGGSSSRGKEVM